MNSNTRSRLLLFFIGIPLFAATLFFIPFAHYIVLAALILTIQYLSSLEMRKMMPAAGLVDPGVAIVIVGLVQSTLVYAMCALDISPSRILEVLILTFSVFLCILFAPLGFRKKEHFPELLKFASAISLSYFYTAFLPSLLMLIASGFPEARNAIISFAMLTLGNDSLAWLFGKYLGKRRSIVEVSPNKSIAGFLGGSLGSIAAAFITLGPLNASHVASAGQYIFQSLALGVGMAFFVIAGDLFESALKRAAGTKDSGFIVPGRGGVLDSFDSLYFSAPFFVALSFFFHLFGL